MFKFSMTGVVLSVVSGTIKGLSRMLDIPRLRKAGSMMVYMRNRRRFRRDISIELSFINTRLERLNRETIDSQDPGKVARAYDEAMADIFPTIELVNSVLKQMVWLRGDVSDESVILRLTSSILSTLGYQREKMERLRGQVKLNAVSDEMQLLRARRDPGDDCARIQHEDSSVQQK